MTRPRTLSLAGALAVVLGLAPLAAAAAVTTVSAPTVTTGAITSVTPSGAVATGTLNPNGAVTSWYFEYGLSTAAGYADKSAPQSEPAGSTDVRISATLTGLSPATSYRYALVATNSAGSTDGASGVFNTSAAPTVVTGVASAITASSATLSGDVNPEGLSTSWYFQYGATTAYGSATPTMHLAAGPNDVTVSAKLANLAPNATYHFRVVASSSAGSSDGTDASFQTNLPVTLNSSTSTVTYGGFVQLSGFATSGRSGVTVTIESEPYNASGFVGTAAVLTSSGGEWSYATRPTVRTTYRAMAAGGNSSSLVVSVRPVVYLNQAAGGMLLTRVVGAMSFGEHVLQLQRLIDGLWVTWKPVRLNTSGRAEFSTLLPKGKTPVRMAIGPFVPGLDQAGPGYLAGFSRVLDYQH